MRLRSVPSAVLRHATYFASARKKQCGLYVHVNYAQLVQTKNKQCKSAIILQCHLPHLSDFCSRPRLTSYNHPGGGVAKIYLVFF